MASDPTFTSYTPEQAASYASGRDSSYPPELYNEILKCLPSSSPSDTILLDVGCGPGNVLRDLALFVSEAIGTDPSEAMVGEARKISEDLGVRTKTGKVLRFEVGCAEACDEVRGLANGSVDLLVAGMAAHWFDMEKFWPACANIVRPGGTVALWTCASLYCHPSTPNAAKVQEILFRFERETLAPYELPGNRLSRNMYTDLVLPWDHKITTPLPFSIQDFTRREWDKDGIPSSPSGEFLGGSETESLEHLEKGLGTASMVTRWRQDPKNAGREDCVKALMRELRNELQGEESLRTGSGTVLLLLRRDL